MSVIGGGVFYDEFRMFDTTQVIFFPCGVLITVVGVFYLSQRGPGDKDNGSGVVRSCDCIHRLFLMQG